MKYSLLTTSNSNSLVFINRYLRSINKQKILPYEVIFINDGILKIDSKKIINKILNKKIKLIFIENKKNLGILKSLNKGLKKIRTNLIFRLDVDDTWNRDHSEYMIKQYKQNNKYLIYSNSSKHFSKGIVDEMLILDNPTIHSSWVINKNLLTNFKYCNIDKHPEDYGTLSKYYRCGYKYKIVKKKTVNYYNINNSFSKKTEANRNLQKIREKNLKHYLKKNSYIDLINELKVRGIIKCIVKILIKKY
jgi:cellulose synthase/poly-beta-1,6-N-acetylglucosamine synthase-like glycosyltransferase